jgi:hypothetical protein
MRLGDFEGPAIKPAPPGDYIPLGRRCVFSGPFRVREWLKGPVPIPKVYPGLKSIKQTKPKALAADCLAPARHYPIARRNGPSPGKAETVLGAMPGAARHECSIRPVYIPFRHNSESGLPVRSFTRSGDDFQKVPWRHTRRPRDLRARYLNQRRLSDHIPLGRCCVFSFITGFFHPGFFLI